MKRIPTVINDCLDCPFCYAQNIKGRLKCEHVFPEDHKSDKYILSVYSDPIHVMGIDDKIPEWCPLEDAAVVELARLESTKREAEKALKLVRNIGQVIKAIDDAHIFPTSDIITRYMRKQIASTLPLVPLGTRKGNILNGTGQIYGKAGEDIKVGPVTGQANCIKNINPDVSMTIDKAIEFFIQYQKTPDSLDLPNPRDFKDALSMGIAALSRIRYQRLNPTVTNKALLPGETKE